MSASSRRMGARLAVCAAALMLGLGGLALRRREARA